MRSNQDWVQALRADGALQEAALRDLRERLVRAVRGYLARQGSGRGSLGSEAAAQLAQDCAQEALLLVLQKLETFRGESQFTTWAYQIAIHLVLGKLRRRWWKEISLEGSRIGEELPPWPIDGPRPADPEKALQQEQCWGILKEVIEKELTERQRSVLVAHAFQGMPLDQVADSIGTNRDNVYKIIHDARRKLRKCLLERGLSQEEILGAFEATA